MSGLKTGSTPADYQAVCRLDQTPHPAAPLDVFGHQFFGAFESDLGPFDAPLGIGDLGRHPESVVFFVVHHGFVTHGWRYRSLLGETGAT